jgi:hypothetical protein
VRAEAGTRPGGRPPFLSRDKKGGADSAPHSLRPLRGNLRRGACGVRRITHYAAAQLRKERIQHRHQRREFVRKLRPVHKIRLAGHRKKLGGAVAP